MRVIGDALNVFKLLDQRPFAQVDRPSRSRGNTHANKDPLPPRPVAPRRGFGFRRIDLVQRCRLASRRLVKSALRKRRLSTETLRAVQSLWQFCGGRIRDLLPGERTTTIDD
jgi:hypothetical protein